MAPEEGGRVKFAEVKSILSVTSQGKWSLARTAATAELERQGIAAEGRGWVRQKVEGRAAKGWVRAESG